MLYSIYLITVKILLLYHDGVLLYTSAAQTQRSLIEGGVKNKLSPLPPRV